MSVDEYSCKKTCLVGDSPILPASLFPKHGCPGLSVKGGERQRQAVKYFSVGKRKKKNCKLAAKNYRK